jgi:hypothetical protein
MVYIFKLRNVRHQPQRDIILHTNMTIKYKNIKVPVFVLKLLVIKQMVLVWM